MNVFWVVYAVTIVQRLSELALAGRHTRQILAEGGYEAGRSHYKWVVCLHTGFFAGLLVEVNWRTHGTSSLFPLWLGLYLAGQALRYWAIHALGKYWNTRILVVPGMIPVRKGPYRFFSHPNYIAVVVELAAIPLMFDAFITAAAATIANGIVLKRRIRVEEAALRDAALKSVQIII